MTFQALFDPTRLAAVLLVCPLACGAGAIIGEGDTGDTGDTGDGDTGDGDTGDGDTGDTDDTGATDDTDDTGDDNPLADACIEDGQLTRSIAVVDAAAEQVHVVGPGDQTMTLSASLPVAAPAGTAATISLSVSSEGAEFIAVASNYAIYTPNQPMEKGAMLRLYARDDGELLWARSFDDRRLGQIFVDPEGRVTATIAWDLDATSTGMIVIDGQPTDLIDFAPAGPLTSADWVPGWIHDGVLAPVGSGFYQPFQDQLVQVTDDDVVQGWKVVGETIEFIDDSGPVPEFVVARPDATSRIELPHFAGLDSPLIQESSLAGDYRLLVASLQIDMPPLLSRLRVSTGELLPITITPPAGLEPFDCYSPSATVDLDGRILVELRDSGSAQIHAFDPEADEWTAVGVPMTEVDDIGSYRRFGRVEVIHGYGANTTFCPSADWSDPPATAIANSSIQLARIDPPLSLVLEQASSWTVSVDRAEQCASWFESESDDGLGDGEWVIHDLDDGDSLSLGVSGTPLWLE